MRSCGWTRVSLPHEPAIVGNDLGGNVWLWGDDSRRSRQPGKVRSVWLWGDDSRRSRQPGKVRSVWLCGEDSRPTTGSQARSGLSGCVVSIHVESCSQTRSGPVCVFVRRLGPERLRFTRTEREACRVDRTAERLRHSLQWCVHVVA